jgi:uncharacterized membrane protein
MYHVGPWAPFGGWLVGLVVTAAFILLIAWGVASILRRDSHQYRGPIQPPPMAPPPGVDPALQILRERFARGEISEAEFTAASRVLGAPTSPAVPPPERPLGPPS